MKYGSRNTRKPSFISYQYSYSPPAYTSIASCSFRTLLLCRCKTSPKIFTEILLEYYFKLYNLRPDGHQRVMKTSDLRNPYVDFESELVSLSKCLTSAVKLQLARCKFKTITRVLVAPSVIVALRILEPARKTVLTSQQYILASYIKHGMDFLLDQFLADTSRKSGDTSQTGHFSENDPDPFPELLLTNYGNRGKFNILEINYTK